MTIRQVAAFLVLCLWSSAGWLTVDLLPGQLAPAAGQGVHFLLIGVVVFLFQVVQGGDGFEVPAKMASLVAVGAGTIAVPLALLDGARAMSAAIPGVVVFSLVPVVVIVGVGRLALLLPALAGVAGVLLLVPSQLPGSATGWEGLGLTVLAAALTGFGLVLLPSLLKGVRTASAVASISLACGLLLSLVGLLLGESGWSWSALGIELLRGLLLDLPEVVLLLWLIEAVAPFRVAARYLVAPLLTVLEGYLFLRPRLDMRTVAGVVLLAAGSWRLLMTEAEEEPGLGLLSTPDQLDA